MGTAQLIGGITAILCGMLSIVYTTYIGWIKKKDDSKHEWAEASRCNKFIYMSVMAVCLVVGGVLVYIGYKTIRFYQARDKF